MNRDLGPLLKTAWDIVKVLSLAIAISAGLFWLMACSTEIDTEGLAELCPELPEGVDIFQTLKDQEAEIARLQEKLQFMVGARNMCQFNFAACNDQLARFGQFEVICRDNRTRCISRLQVAREVEKGAAIGECFVGEIVDDEG